MSYIQDFEKLVQEQLKRVERMKNEPPAIDYSGLDKIIIGFVDGDGIGPVIMKQTRRVLDEILREDVAEGRVEMRTVEGLTLENRVARKETLPAEVLEQIRQCNVFLKGPTTTPNETMNMPNLESANVRFTAGTRSVRKCQTDLHSGTRHRLDVFPGKYRR